MNLPYPFAVTVAIAIGIEFLWFLPNLTRPDLFFARTVPVDFRGSANARDILRRYRLELVASAAAALALLWISGWNLRARAGAGIAIFDLGLALAYLNARRRVAPFAVAPTTAREAETGPRRVRLPGGWPLQCGPFLILAAAAVQLRRHWNQLPPRFPVHWDLAGHANAWAERGDGYLVHQFLMALGVIAMVLFLAYASVRWSRRMHASGAAAAAEGRFQRMILAIGLLAAYVVALMSAGIMLRPLYAASGDLRLWAFSGPLLSLPLLGLALVLAFHFGQGGSRLAAHAASGAAGGEAPVGDRTPDCCWKAGIFYVNRADPAIFVEKRFGVGYTLNFGHPIGWLLMAVPVGCALAAILRHHH